MSPNNPKILDSELILNPDGSVYHLSLKPSDIADTIITVGDPDRVSLISRHFDEIELKVQCREFITHTGYLNKKRLTVISTGIGTSNIDIVLNELDALVNIDLENRVVKPNLKSLDIIRIGTAGGLQADTAVDSFVFSEHAIGLESALNFYATSTSSEEAELLRGFVQHLGNQLPVHPYIASAHPKFKQIFNDGFEHGITATCGGFYAAQGRMLRAPLAIPNFIEQLQTFNQKGKRIANFEMETSAIYGLGKVLNHHCCSLSMIINNRVEKKFSEDPGKSMDRLICLALERIT